MNYSVELQKAQQRIGGDDSDYANWLLALARRDLDSLSEKEWENLQWEAVVFRDFPNFPDPDDVFAGLEAQPRQDVIKLRRLIRVMLHRLPKKYVQAQFHPELTYTAELQDGRLRVTEETTLVMIGQLWHLKLFRLLHRLQHRFRFCTREDCGQPFVARHLRQQFCSPRCNQTTRMRRYRAKHNVLERLGAKRREVYRRAKEAMLTTMYTEVRPALIRVASRYLRDESYAEDVVLDAITECVKRKQKRGPGGIRNPRAWLRTVVERQARVLAGKKALELEFNEDKYRYRRVDTAEEAAD